MATRQSKARRALALHSCKPLHRRLSGAAAARAPACLHIQLQVHESQRHLHPAEVLNEPRSAATAGSVIVLWPARWKQSGSAAGAAAVSAAGTTLPPRKRARSAEQRNAPAPCAGSVRHGHLAATISRDANACAEHVAGAPAAQHETVKPEERAPMLGHAWVGVNGGNAAGKASAVVDLCEDA